MPSPSISLSSSITSQLLGKLISKIIFDTVRKIIPRLSDYKVVINDTALSAQEMAENLAKAKIVISRAGANTIEELAYLGKPAILIPIPWASGAEQQKNAESLGDGAVIINQADLSAETLLAAVEKIEKNYPAFLGKAKENKKLVHPDAAEKIVEEIEKIVKDD